MRKGQGEVYGEGAAYVIDSRQPYRFTGSNLREYQYVDVPRFDEFDRWSRDRDRRYDSSISARYVSQDVLGFQELDAHGSWRVDATFGNVWFPNRVAAQWAPYRDGHWAWVDPWGWTWVDDAPWGFAVSHYGRWAYLRGAWGWIPGPASARAYYAPALVAFVGGSNFQISISLGNVGAVGWFPLAPREVYRPAYAVSRGYFENVNRSNTVINNTVINNYYDNSRVTNVVYANRPVPGAVVAVPTTVFVQSQPVSRAAVPVTREMISQVPVAAIAPVAPTDRSVRGAADRTDRPPARVFARPVVARTAPPAAHAGFTAQQEQLKARPGQPIDDSVRRELKPAAAAPAPAVRVITQTQAAPPTVRPPRAAPDAKSGGARGKPDERTEPAAPATSGVSRTPGAATGGDAAPKATAPAPAAQPPAPRETQPQVAPSQPAPAVARPAQPPEQRGRSDQRGNVEQRPQPVAPTPVTPQGASGPKAVRSQRVTEPKAVPSQPASPAQVTLPLPQSAPKVEPRSQESKPAVSRSSDAKMDADERKREAEERRKLEAEERKQNR